MAYEQRYSALSTDPEVVETVLRKMEGLLSKLRNIPEDKRPKSLPVIYLAAELGCSPRTVRVWLVHHDKRRKSSDLSDRFCEIYALITAAMIVTLHAKTFAIAYDTSNPASFRALQWLLKIADPLTFGDEVIAEDEGTATADITSATLDSLTDEERDTLRAVADRRARDDRTVEELLKKAGARAQDEANDLESDP